MNLHLYIIIHVQLNQIYLMLCLLHAKNDGYVLRDGIPHMNDVWPGCHIRYIPRGHISAFLLNQSGFQHAVAEMLQRQQPNVKLKKNPITSPISVTTKSNS